MIRKICIIVSYNRPEKIKQSITLCLKHGVTDLIVVDNCSDEKTTNILKSFESDNLHIIYNNSNVGASKAFKIGAEYVLGLNFKANDIVTFLDDDSYISSRFYTSLDQVNVGDDFFIAPKVITPDGSILRMNQPLKLLPTTLLSSLRYLHNRPVPKGNEMESIKTASFVGLTLKLETLSKYVKYIRDDFFIYYDDVFFTFKMSTYGVKGIYCPDLIVFHDTTDKKRVSSDILLYYIIRNGVFTQKNITRWWWLIEIPRLIYYACNVISKPDKIKLIILAFNDGLHIK